MCFETGNSRWSSNGIKLYIAFKGFQEEGCQCHCWLWRASHCTALVTVYAFTVTLTSGTQTCIVTMQCSDSWDFVIREPHRNFLRNSWGKESQVAVEFEVRTVPIVSGFSSPVPVSVLSRHAAPSLAIIKTTLSKVCFPLCSFRFLPFYWNWGQFAILCRGTLNLVASDLTLEVWILVQSSLLFVLYLMIIKILSQFAFLNRVRAQSYVHCADFKASVLSSFQNLVICQFSWHVSWGVSFSTVFVAPPGKEKRGYLQ